MVDGSVPANVIALQTEAFALLTELEDASRSESASASRFTEVGADEGIVPDEGSGSIDFQTMAARRIEHGSQAHLMAFQVR